MIVIPPIQITEAMLTSSIPEPDASVGEAAWNPATSYVAGTRVIRTTTHKVYEKVAPDGVDAGLPEVTPSKWVEVGPTNRWAMFDTSRSTQSTSTTDIIVTISPGARFNAIVVVGSTATSVETSVSSPSTGVVFTSTDNMYSRTSFRWYEYFFKVFNLRTQLLKTNIPPVSSSSVTITARVGGSGLVALGGILLGSAVFLGDVQVSPSIESTNFSKIERDVFGNANLVPRRVVPKTTQETLVHRSHINKIMATRELLNAVPALWAGLTDDTHGYFEPLLIFGIYKEFAIDMTYPDHAKINLELEEI